MPAVAVREEAEALARAVRPPADAHVIESAHAQPVNGKAPTADLARDLMERVIGRGAGSADAKDADAIGFG